MKKESIIVGIFGLSLGLLVAWGIWNFKSAAPQPQELTPPPAAVTTPIPTPTPSTLLTLDNPPQNHLATKSSTLVSGKTKAGSTIVISGSLGDEVLTAGEDGSFSQEINLEEGENAVTVTAYSTDEKEETVERIVVYTEESL